MSVASEKIQDLGDLIFDNGPCLKDDSYKNMLDKLKDIMDTVPIHNHRVYAYLETKYIINEGELTEEIITIVTHFKFLILLNKRIDHLIQDDLDIYLKIIMNNNLGRLQFKELKHFINAYKRHSEKLFDLNKEDPQNEQELKILDTTIDYLSIESLELFWE